MKQKAFTELRQALNKRGVKFYPLLAAFGLTKTELLAIEAGEHDYAPLLRFDIWRQLGATEAEIQALEAIYVPPAPDVRVPIMPELPDRLTQALIESPHAICLDCLKPGAMPTGRHGECRICAQVDELGQGPIDIEGLLPLCDFDADFLQALGRAYQRGELKRQRAENTRHRGRARNARKLLHDCLPIPIEELQAMFPPKAEA